jgi:hypothetical protein
VPKICIFYDFYGYYLHRQENIRFIYKTFSEFLPQQDVLMVCRLLKPLDDTCFSAGRHLFRSSVSFYTVCTGFGNGKSSCYKNGC